MREELINVRWWAHRVLRATNGTVLVFICCYWIILSVLCMLNEKYENWKSYRRRIFLWLMSWGDFRFLLGTFFGKWIIGDLSRLIEFFLRWNFFCGCKIFSSSPIIELKNPQKFSGKNVRGDQTPFVIEICMSK